MVRRLKSVKAGKARFSLELVWEDGTTQAVDLFGLVFNSRHFRRFLSEPDGFLRAEIINWGHGIAWPNGLDYSGENLARMAEEQQGSS